MNIMNFIMVSLDRERQQKARKAEKLCEEKKSEKEIKQSQKINSCSDLPFPDNNLEKRHIMHGLMQYRLTCYDPIGCR